MSKPTDTIEVRYIEALRKLKVRTDTLEEMARWKQDLSSRLWRAEVVLRVTGEFLYDAKALEIEVRMYTEICAKLKANALAARQNDDAK